LPRFSVAFSVGCHDCRPEPVGTRVLRRGGANRAEAGERPWQTTSVSCGMPIRIVPKRRIRSAHRDHHGVVAVAMSSWTVSSTMLVLIREPRAKRRLTGVRQLHMGKPAWFSQQWKDGGSLGGLRHLRRDFGSGAEMRPQPSRNKRVASQPCFSACGDFLAAHVPGSGCAGRLVAEGCRRQASTVGP